MIFPTFEMSSDMQRYAAICSGIIKNVGDFVKLMEIYDISLKC